MRTLIIGSGGHGRVIADILDVLCEPVIGFLDRDTTRPNVLGTDDQAGQIIADENIDSFMIGIGSIRGGPSLRSRLFVQYAAMGLTPRVAVHPSAVISKSVSLGEGTVVMAGAIINSNVRTGVNAIINTGAIIDHDCYIGDHTHIAPGCVLSGDVKIGAHCLLGTGTIARNGAKLGKNSTIGAGSLLLGNYAADQIYFGNPARTR